ncbi:MAG: ribokinase [Acidimicrobiales bacterium]
MTVVGSINVDLTFRVPILPTPGMTVLADRSIVRRLGGKGANQAVAAAACGSTVELVAAVGDDRAGQDALDSLRNWGVGTGGVGIRLGHPTGTAFIVVDDVGENMIVVSPGGNLELSPDQTRRRIRAQRPAVVLAQLEIPLDAVAAAADARPPGCRMVINPAPMAEPFDDIRTLIERADLLVPNRSELGQLVGRPTPVSIDDVDRCVERLGFVGELVVTLGADGAAVYDGGRRFILPPEPVKTVDTSGAGDVFCGALAHRLAAGDRLLEAARAANRMAALSTTLPGAQLPVGFGATVAHQPE